MFYLFCGLDLVVVFSWDSVLFVRRVMDGIQNGVLFETKYPVLYSVYIYFDILL